MVPAECVSSLLLFTVIAIGLCEGSSLETITSCICIGQDVIFECVVDGNMTGGTYWQGSALRNCENGGVIVRHSDIISNRNATSSCGLMRKVQAFPISSHTDSFTSQLVVFDMYEQLNNSNVTCATETERLIGITPIVLTDPLPPSDVFISSFNKKEVLFTWSSVHTSLRCPSVRYEINHINCGNCPEHTYSNTIVCNNTYGHNFRKLQVCNLTLRTIICDNDVYSPYSEQAIFKVKDISKDNILVIAEYDKLEQVIVRAFVEFTINDKFRARSDQYIVWYIDTFNKTCGNVTIDVSDCDNNTCSTLLNVSSCTNSTEILVRVVPVKNQIHDTNIESSDGTSSGGKDSLAVYIAVGSAFSLVLLALVVIIVVLSFVLIKIVLYQGQQYS